MKRKQIEETKLKSNVYRIVFVRHFRLFSFTLQTFIRFYNWNKNKKQTDRYTGFICFDFIRLVCLSPLNNIKLRSLWKWMRAIAGKCMVCNILFSLCYKYLVAVCNRLRKSTLKMCALVCIREKVTAFTNWLWSHFSFWFHILVCVSVCLYSSWILRW